MPLEYWSTPSAGRVLSSTRVLPSIGWRGQALLNGVLEAAESSSDRGAEAYGRARAHNMARGRPARPRDMSTHTCIRVYVQMYASRRVPPARSLGAS